MPGIDECLLEAMRLPGARGAALVDWTSGLALGAVGEPPGGDHETTAAEAAELARLAAEHGAFAATATRTGTRTGTGTGTGTRTGTGTGTGTGTEDDGRPPVEDLIVSNRDSYHLLRFVETGFDSTVFLHLWLTPAEGNLALA
ncbi:hypothetical protein GTY54_24475, partial [Streptomyces sp. SID625]|nr:hypothetical protein [Streptomyces sp. SID625]